ncbi:MAG: hypothetical protein ABSC76_08670 [Terracidiphilus sp.]
MIASTVQDLQIERDEALIVTAISNYILVVPDNSALNITGDKLAS